MKKNMRFFQIAALVFFALLFILPPLQYRKGYDTGYADAQAELLSEFSDDYAEAYESGYDDGLSVGYDRGAEEGWQDNFAQVELAVQEQAESYARDQNDLDCEQAMWFVDAYLDQEPLDGALPTREEFETGVSSLLDFYDFFYSDCWES